MRSFVPEGFIYLDHNSTTPVDERVLQKMLPYMKEYYGNAGSRTHLMGWIANQAIEEATEKTGEAIGNRDGELIFTSGSTEAINLAIKGIMASYSNRGNHVITSHTEHKAVLDVLEGMEKRGMIRISYLPVNTSGEIDIHELDSLIEKETVLVCLMLANNETGVIHPVKQVADLCRGKEIFYFCDATQGPGKMKIEAADWGIDMMAFSAHKCNGPKGIGVLYIDRSHKKMVLTSQIEGGGQQKGLRSGTLPVAQITGMGEAFYWANRELSDRISHYTFLRNHLESELSGHLSITVHSGLANRLPNTSNIAINGVNNVTLMKKLSTKVAVSTGSACTSDNPAPSHVLKAMGISVENIRSSIRLSVGEGNTREEIDRAVEIILKAV